MEKIATIEEEKGSPGLLPSFLMEDNDRYEFECPVCMDLLVDPCALPCDHVFCRKCIKLVVKKKMLCPMCRVAIQPKFAPTLNKVFQDRLRERFPEEFKQEMEKLESESTLKFVYGYVCHKKGRVPGTFGGETKYDYTLFFKCKEADERVGKYVSKVRFNIPAEKKMSIPKESHGRFEMRCGETTKPLNVVIKVWWDRSLRKWEKTLAFQLKPEEGVKEFDLAFFADKEPDFSKKKTNV